MANQQVVDQSGLRLTSALAQGWGLAGASLFGGAALSFLTSALLIRYANPAVYGDYASLAAAVGLGAFVMRLGLDRLATREIRVAAAEGTDRVVPLAAGLLAAATALILIGGTITAVGAAVVARQFDFGLGVCVLVVTWLIAEAFRPIVVEVLRARLRLVAASIAGSGGRALAMLIAAIAVIQSNRTELEGLLLIGVVGAVVPVLIGLWGNRNSGWWTGSALRRGANLVRNDLRSISYFSLAGWSALLITSADLLVIRWLGSGTEAASYAAAITLAGTIGIVSTSVNLAIGPMSHDIVGRGEVGRGESGRTVERGAEAAVRSLTTIAGGLALVAVVVVTAIAWIGLAALGGSSYDKTYILVFVLAVGQLSGVLAGPCGTVLMLAGQERHVARVLTVTGIGAVAFEGVALAATGSIVAVAIVSAAAVLVHNVWLAVSARRLLGLRTSVAGSIGEARSELAVARQFGSDLVVSRGD